MTHKKEKGAHADMHLTSALNKEIMSEIREGDYQHPGEEEAIELVFKGIAQHPDQLLLDVGCGRGGTASYLQNKGWGKVIGLDLNIEIIEFAKKKYEKEGEAFPRFLACDATDVASCFSDIFSPKVKPDVIYLFNSFFLFDDHVKALKALRAIAHKNTKLIVFDYVDNGNYMENPYKENGKPFLPNCIKSSKIHNVFEDGGWKTSEIKNIDEAMFAGTKS